MATAMRHMHLVKKYVAFIHGSLTRPINIPVCPASFQSDLLMWFCFQFLVNRYQSSVRTVQHQPHFGTLTLSVSLNPFATFKVTDPATTFKSPTEFISCRFERPSFQVTFYNEHTYLHIKYQASILHCSTVREFLCLFLLISGIIVQVIMCVTFTFHSPSDFLPKDRGYFPS
jgi:hypothetical protein